ncbi:hypothetical protein KKF55_06010 [Patescibacteria group bacterium]|nr:hypothetical protein [Patescibacteria group bacterium]
MPINSIKEEERFIEACRKCNLAEIVLIKFGIRAIFETLMGIGHTPNKDHMKKLCSAFVELDDIDVQIIIAKYLEAEPSPVVLRLILENENIKPPRPVRKYLNGIGNI